MAKKLFEGKLRTCYICYEAQTKYYTEDGVPVCKSCRELYLGWPPGKAKIINSVKPKETVSSIKPKTGGKTSTKKGPIIKPDNMSEKGWSKYVKKLKEPVSRLSLDTW